jgi:hypothetical protein
VSRHAPLTSHSAMPQAAAARVRSIVTEEFSRAMADIGHEWMEAIFRSDIELPGEWNRRGR